MMSDAVVFLFFFCFFSKKFFFEENFLNSVGYFRSKNKMAHFGELLLAPPTVAAYALLAM
jgi:hypothetical protein